MGKYEMRDCMNSARFHWKRVFGRIDLNHLAFSAAGCPASRWSSDAPWFPPAAFRASAGQLRRMRLQW